MCTNVETRDGERIQTKGETQQWSKGPHIRIQTEPGKQKRSLADENAKEDGDGAHARAYEEAERVAARVFRDARAPEITSDDLGETKTVRGWAGMTDKQNAPGRGSARGRQCFERDR